MNRQKCETGVDRMRLAAAFLVVAIHISPFADRSAAADFLLTRVVARLAVPFFFMASGYFTLSRYDTNGERLRRFMQKTAALYAVGIALYLPLSVYGGYFSGSIPDLFRKIVFDGTMYHLWYLPAAMLGMLIARHLMRRLDYPAALAVAAALYLIGLFGDSYYGLAANAPVLGSFYDVLFTAFSYTRNGLFFAPIFLLLGGVLAEKKRTLSLPAALAGLAVGMIFMTAEALLLRRYDVPRHDSMTIFLLPSSWFLFQILLCFKGRRVRGLRTASMLIYLIHPMMIVLVRGLAKALHLQKLLVEDHLVFYLLVCVLSAAFGFGAAMIRERFGRKKDGTRRFGGESRSIGAQCRGAAKRDAEKLRIDGGRQSAGVRTRRVSRGSAFGTKRRQGVRRCDDRRGDRTSARRDSRRDPDFGIHGRTSREGFKEISFDADFDRFFLCRAAEPAKRSRSRPSCG